MHHLDKARSDACRGLLTELFLLILKERRLFWHEAYSQISKDMKAFVIAFIFFVRSKVMYDAEEAQKDERSPCWSQ